MGVFIEPALLPKSGDGFCQLIFLLLVYGCVHQPTNQPIDRSTTRSNVHQPHAPLITNQPTNQRIPLGTSSRTRRT